VKFEERLKAPVLKTLYAYWQEIRGNRPAPRRNDIDPSEIVSVLPYLALLDVESAPRRYRVRLIGTTVVSWYGSDFTGRYLHELDFGSGNSFSYTLLDQIVDRVAPGHMSGEYRKADGRLIRYERVYMPLSNDGEAVDMLLGAALRLPPEAPILGDCLDL